MKDIQLQSNSQGIVSLLVTMILVIILSIIVISFGNFTRREEVQVLDRQLNAEAFYAAESGINDAREVLRNTPAGTGLLVNEKTDCQGGPYGALFDEELQGDNVKYSCLLIDPHPNALEYGNLGKGESIVIPIQDKDNQPISGLEVHWNDTQINGPINFNGCDTSDTALPPTWPSVNACSASMLRIELVEFPNSGTFTTAQLESSNNTKVVYVKPRNGGGGNWNFRNATTGDIEFANCVTSSPTYNRPKQCRLRINNINRRLYYARITSLYKGATMTICSVNCASRSRELAGAQALIDSTGRASEILRRIQVRVGIGPEGPFPGYAIESSEDICKQFAIAPSTSLVEVSDGSGCSLP